MCSSLPTGKDRAQRQQLCFCQVGFARGLRRIFKGGRKGLRKSRQRARGPSADAPANRPLPFKVQVYTLLVGQLEEQGMDAEVARGLTELRVEETCEALQFKEPPEEVSKAWVVVLLLKATWSTVGAGWRNCVDFVRIWYIASLCFNVYWTCLTL